MQRPHRPLQEKQPFPAASVTFPLKCEMENFPLKDFLSCDEICGRRWQYTVCEVGSMAGMKKDKEELN